MVLLHNPDVHHTVDCFEHDRLLKKSLRMLQICPRATRAMSKRTDETMASKCARARIQWSVIAGRP